MPIRKNPDEIQYEEYDIKTPQYNLYLLELDKKNLYELNEEQLKEVKEIALKEGRYELARLIKLEQRKRNEKLNDLTIDELKKMIEPAIEKEDYDLILLIEDIIFERQDKFMDDLFNQNADGAFLEKINKLKKNL